MQEIYYYRFVVGLGVSRKNDIGFGNREAQNCVPSMISLDLGGGGVPAVF